MKVTIRYMQIILSSNDQKTCQYGGLTILGIEGYQRLKDWLKRKKR